MLKAVCSSVESLADFWRSPCMLPAAEKTRSTPAEEAGAAKYCLTISWRAPASARRRPLTPTSALWLKRRCRCQRLLLRRHSRRQGASASASTTRNIFYAEIETDFDRFDRSGAYSYAAQPHDARHPLHSKPNQRSQNAVSTPVNNLFNCQLINRHL